MPVRFLSKISLFAAVLALTQFVNTMSSEESVLCSSVLAADVETTGESGDDGVTGAKGKDGRNSDDLTVFADGNPMTLDLTGGHGTKGLTGAKGEDAFCEQQTEAVGKNLRGADGGNGARQVLPCWQGAHLSCPFFSTSSTQRRVLCVSQHDVSARIVAAVSTCDLHCAVGATCAPWLCMLANPGTTNRRLRAAKT